MTMRLLRLVPTKFPSFLRPTCVRSISLISHKFPEGFLFWPDYFSKAEQRTLLAASLHKLDSNESRQARRRRKEYWRTNPVDNNSGNAGRLFAPDDLYEFQKGHYDGVIHHFREMHLSSWPVEEFRDLQPTLERLHSLCPTKSIQTHLLHLASNGDILPHVDNLGASGSWILGVSLGDERILRLKKVGDESQEFSISLPSGTVYLQRDNVRYNYEHSIERRMPDGGQRLSIMIRDQNRENVAMSLS